MIDQYLEDNYEILLEKVKMITKNHDAASDLLNDCILNFLEKGSDYINQVVQDNKIENYLIKMVHIQFNSSSSPFYRKYRKSLLKSVEVKQEHIEEIDELEIKEDKAKLAEDIKIYIGKLPLYNKTIANEHFVEGKSQRQISRMYNINRLHITKDLKTVKSNIKQKFNRDDYRSY